MKKAFNLIWFILPLWSASRTTQQVVPEPVQMQRLTGVFILDSSSIIHTPPSLKKEADIFAEYVRKYYHVPISVTEVDSRHPKHALTNHRVLWNSNPPGHHHPITWKQRKTVV